MSETLILTVVTTIYFLLSFILLAYGCIKWKQFYDHFLISGRFPKIINSLVILCIIVQIILIITKWVSINSTSDSIVMAIFDGLIPAILFASTALIIYRILLIYFRYTKAQQLILENKSLTDTIAITIKIDHNINKLAIPFSIYVVIFSIFSIMGGVLAHSGVPVGAMLIGLPFVSVVIFGITCVIFIKCKNVKEGVGCLRETYFMLIYLTFTLIISAMGGKNPPIFVLYAQIGIIPLLGLLPIYFTLYYINKTENTLDVNMWKQKHRSSISEASKSHISVARGSDDVENISLFKYLTLKQNYHMYVDYLAHCFAEESILFVQNVSVIYQIIQSISAPTDNVNNDEINDKKAKSKIIPRITFLYLGELYSKYKDQLNIKDDLENVNMSFDDSIRDLLYQTINDLIFNEYIVEGSNNEINISAETRRRIKYYFVGDKKDKFQSFEDFSLLFDEALKEIYTLMFSLYSYRFVEFIQERQNNN